MEQSSEVSTAGQPDPCRGPAGLLTATHSRKGPGEARPEASGSIPPGRVSPDLHGANPRRQERGLESSGYSPGAEPAWPELTVAGIGQLPDSAEAEGPRKLLGHALLAGQYRWDTDLQGQKDIPSVTWRDRNQI